MTNTNKNYKNNGKNNAKDDNFSFEIKENLATLSANENSGWTKEFNVVAWNGNEPKLDIREWDPEHSYMSKGVTLTKEEALIVFEVLSERLGEAAAEAEEMPSFFDKEV